MSRKTINIEFPSAGVARRLGLRVAAGGGGPLPAPWATNVRLEDSLSNRLRGGSFTAIAAGSRIAPVYRHRAITFSGKVVTAARVGEAIDKTVSTDVTDLSRAVHFTLADAGVTANDVVAVIPHKDAHLLCFTASEMWVLDGNPATPKLRRVSNKVGIIGANAWCINHDTVCFLSSSGLYSAGADGSGLKAISEDKIPEDLTGVVDSGCTLTYNHADRGIYIHRSSGVSWFYDTERDGFWPFSLASTDSHVLIGPFVLGQPNARGRVLNLHGVIATGSTDVTWRLVPGDTAEQAAANGKAGIVADLVGGSYASYVPAEGTWSAGRAHIAYPRIPAVWCCLWLRSEGAWAFEEVIMTATLAGAWR